MEAGTRDSLVTNIYGKLLVTMELNRLQKHALK